MAAVVKGAIGLGFPTIATPLLALVTDVRTAVVVLLLPTIVMDGIQVVVLVFLGVLGVAMLARAIWS